MIDKWELITHPEVMKLARRIKKETGCAQIRMWPVINKAELAKLGENSVCFCVLVENPKWDPNHPDDSENFHMIFRRVTLTICVSGDPGQHDLIEDLKLKIKAYLDSLN